MADKLIRSKFPGSCRACNCAIPVGAEIRWSKASGARHAAIADCEAAKAAAVATLPQAGLTMDLSSIVRFVAAAKERGLKFPKVRVLAPDGRTEMRLGLTAAGYNPGSLSVRVGGEYVGLVTPTGEVRGLLSSYVYVDVRAALLATAADPAAAAKRYAALTCRCSFCALPLTDEGSVEVGYGPVCAEKYGLPHSPKGTPLLEVVNG